MSLQTPAPQLQTQPGLAGQLQEQHAVLIRNQANSFKDKFPNGKLEIKALIAYSK